MTDKLHPRFALPGHGLVTLEGRDAIGFSHAQFMSDVKQLADDEWHWSGWLTPKGRVIALFALLRRSAESVWLVLPDSGCESFANALRRYVFRSKVEIGAPDVAISGSFDGEPTQGRLAASRSRPWAGSTGGAALDLSGHGGARTLFIGGDRAPEDPDALARWDEFDLAHGLPRLPSAQAEKWTPQQLSLERLNAYSVKKGCYPGQEIVARTHFLGEAKRGLALFGSGREVAPGSEVVVDGRAIGTVVGSAGTLALAVLPRERDPAATAEADGTVLRALPLQGGLAR